MGKVLLNLGFEKKYDLFEQRLKEAGFDVIRSSGRSSEEIIRQGKGCEVAVIGAEDQWNKETLNGLKESLRLIARFGVGLDNVDLLEAKKLGIMVANSAGANKESVAECAVTLMLESVRNISWLDQKLRDGCWKGLPRMHQFSGKTVGLIGFGAIARCVARMVKGFGCRVIATDVFPNQKAAEELGVTFASVEEILEKADFVSLHVPLTKDTYHMVSDDFLSKMKPSAYLINTSRGAVVDETALYKVLASGGIKGAGLDVYEQEPPEKYNPLFQLSNIIVTPHAASSTEEAAGNIADICMENVCSYFKNGSPKYLVK